MRTAFVESLTEMAAKDPRITLVVGDLGFGVVQKFAERFPKQFINAGVAEQNMTGLAAGLAMAGRVVFTYSIANFPTLRPLEQIRNDVCYHNANVVVVTVGGGLAYGALGMSHHATEDISVMRSLPQMTVLAPGDPAEAQAATEKVAQGVGPVYLRLGRAGEPDVHTGPLTNFEIGKAITVREGADLTLMSTGGMLMTATKAADRLAADHGLAVRVVSMPSIKPLDTAAIIDAAQTTGGIVTLEEHSTIGGLGSAVAETMCDADLPSIRLRRLGLPSVYIKEVGSQEYLLKQYGLDADSVAMSVVETTQKWQIKTSRLAA